MLAKAIATDMVAFRTAKTAESSTWSPFAPRKLRNHRHGRLSLCESCGIINMVAFRSAKVAESLRYFRGAKGDHIKFSRIRLKFDVDTAGGIFYASRRVFPDIVKDAAIWINRKLA